MPGEDDHRRAGEPRPTGEDEPPRRPGERQAGAVPEPEPEEAPELLGERSDYPIAWNGEES